MTDDSLLSPGDGSFLQSQHLHITMDDESLESEDLIEDQGEDGEELFEIDVNDHESDDGQHGFENDSEQFLEIDSNLHGESDNVLELEGDDHGNGSEQYLEVKCDDTENDALKVFDNQGNDTISVDKKDGLSEEKYYPPPFMGMEFESYDDAYNYYNFYAKELGFAIRVKSSWTKRNSKEKRGAVLCCNCEGFKSCKEATNRRKETRTGCRAMIRLRLVESNRWRVDEVRLEHNHSFDPERAQNSKSHKKIEVGSKRKLDPSVDVEVQTIKLYRTPATDGDTPQSFTSMEGENGNLQSSHLKLKSGDTQAIRDFFHRKQLTNPYFYYIMELNDNGRLKNIFWIDSRSRASYTYFGDVISIDTTCLSNKYEIPLVAFVGINHHARSILLGCALISDETVETYVWLFRTWLTCMLGRPPQTIITDRFKAMQSAISEVFPRAHHRIFLPLVMQSILLNSGPLQESEAFRSVLNRTVYGSLKIDEFETSWDILLQQFGIMDHEWLQICYDDREKWAPAFLKDTFLAGIFSFQSGEPVIPFFAGHLHENTPVKEFFDIYNTILDKKRKNEALDDLESTESNLLLKTRCYYERQLSKLYTKQIFQKFQVEVEMMPCCVSIDQVQATGPLVTYMVKERDNGGIKEYKNFEVMYDKTTVEVRCICGGFYFNGYLCRHALSVLNHNGVEEIPFSYILSRWRKDCKRLYVPDVGSNAIDTSNPTQWYEHLHKRAMQVVEEGMISQDHYRVACQAFLESLNKVSHTSEKHV